MRHNVNLLLAIVSSMETEEKVEKDNLINTIKVLKDHLNISLERAKTIVDTAVKDKHNDILLSQSSDSNFLATIRDALESVGCICQITES